MARVNPWKWCFQTPLGEPPPDILNATLSFARLSATYSPKWGIRHEKIPVKTPNMIAHIESFHSILEKECYRRHEFESFREAYYIISQYMEFYNNRRRHSSLKYKSPKKFYQTYMQKEFADLKMVV